MSIRKIGCVYTGEVKASGSSVMYHTSACLRKEGAFNLVFRSLQPHPLAPEVPFPPFPSTGAASTRWRSLERRVHDRCCDHDGRWRA